MVLFLTLLTGGELGIKVFLVLFLTLLADGKLEIEVLRSVWR